MGERQAIRFPNRTAQSAWAAQTKRRRFHVRYVTGLSAARGRESEKERGRRLRHIHLCFWRQPDARAGQMMASKGQQRGGVKKGIDSEESRRKREATTVQIRKDKKDDSLQKRRRDFSGGASTPQHREVGALPDPSLKVKLDSLPEDVVLLQSADPTDQVRARARGA